MDDFIKIIEAFNDNKYLRNKLINSLFNNNLFKNDSTLINKLINKIPNLGYEIDSKEILLNIMIYNDKDEASAHFFNKKNFKQNGRKKYC